MNVDEANEAYKSIDGIVYTKDGETCVECPKAMCGSVIIAEGTTSIKERAFYYCTGVTSVDIPDSVTLIDQYAFFHCINLNAVEIPGSVKTIKKNAFAVSVSPKEDRMKMSLLHTGYYLNISRYRILMSRCIFIFITPRE